MRSVQNGLICRAFYAARAAFESLDAGVPFAAKYFKTISVCLLSKFQLFNSLPTNNCFVNFPVFSSQLRVDFPESFSKRFRVPQSKPKQSRIRLI